MRYVLLGAVALSLTMSAVAVVRYRPLLAMPGGLTFVLEPAVALLVYGALIVLATRRGTPPGTRLGLIAAAIQCAHVATENLIHLGIPWDGIVTIAFMLATFLIWGFAGYRLARSTGTMASGVLAGAWSAVVTMSIVAAVGMALEFYWVAPKPQYVATWPEFRRSGWTDVHAFTIANTLDSVLSHLVAGPIVGAIFGGLAGVIARVHRPR